MKRFLVVFICAMVTVFSLGAIESMAESKPSVGVLRFTNNTSAGWWNAGVGNELQDMLASELVSTDSFQVLFLGALQKVRTGRPWTGEVLLPGILPPGSSFQKVPQGGLKGFPCQVGAMKVLGRESPQTSKDGLSIDLRQFFRSFPKGHFRC
jgi:hypothetical protein